MLYMIIYPMGLYSNKEVFQHLTNAEIKKILLKTMKFKYIIITESEPLIPFKPNKDKLKGPECRTDIDQG